MKYIYLGALIGFTLIYLVPFETFFDILQLGNIFVPHPKLTPSCLANAFPLIKNGK